MSIISGGVLEGLGLGRAVPDNLPAPLPGTPGSGRLHPEPLPGRSRRLARLLADRMGDRGGRVCDLQKSGK